MSSIDLAAALEAVRLGEATQAHGAVLAAEVEHLRDLLAVDRRNGDRREHQLTETLSAARAERDEYRAAWLRDVAKGRAAVDTVRAERDRLLAVVVAQAEARAQLAGAYQYHSVAYGNAATRAYDRATSATEALGRELRGGR